MFENHRKVSFNIASEASYIYILSGQKLNKNAKNGPIWRVFENLKLAVKQSYQTDQFNRSKVKNSNATFWVIFKTLCIRVKDKARRGKSCKVPDSICRELQPPRQRTCLMLVSKRNRLLG